MSESNERRPMPAKGRSEDEIFSRMNSFTDDDLSFTDGRAWAYVYHAGERIDEIGRRGFNMFMGRNGLDPTVSPSLMHLENEVVEMALAHLSAGPEAVGTFTSGGTESILLAVKTARDYARRERGIERPQMLVPVTAHAAFHKAAHYFDVEMELIDVDSEGGSYIVDPQRMADAITERTILLVGSAPGYAHGVIDPIEQLGRLAQERNLLLHVDACIGGFLLPYFRRLGAEIPPFDFSVEGVTSISMDLHKYAYVPKGASVIAYRDPALRRHQYFACARWTGYTMVNAAMQSSKSGGPLGASWAVLNHLGDEGYLELARPVFEGSRKLIEGLRSIPELSLMGEPVMSLIAVSSDQLDVFELADEMAARGWYLQPQLAYAGCKENVHFQVEPGNAGRVDELLADLRACVAIVRDKPRAEGGLAAAVGDMLSSIDPAKLGGEQMAQMLAMAGVQGGKLPERRAEINRLLNQIPAELKEKLLCEFLGGLFS